MLFSDIVALAHVGATLLVGFAQVAVVLKGIRAMMDANTERAAAAREDTRQADQRHKEAMAAHAETMAAHAETMAVLKAQAEADDKRHTEAMAALDAQRKASETQSKALETLIERTAPRASDR